MVVEVLSIDSIQNMVATPLKKTREVRIFSTFLSCHVWEPRELACSTPVSLGLGEGRTYLVVQELGSELSINFLCTKQKQCSM